MNWKAVGVGVAAIVGAVVLWFSFKKPEPAPHTAPMEAPASPVVEDAKPQPIQPKKVMAYPAKVKAKSNLPDNMKQDPNVVVLDSSEIPPGDQAQTVTTAMDTQSGSVETIVSEAQKPWFQPEAKNEARLSYGIKNGFKTVGRASVSADMLEVKSLHFGVNGSLDTDGAYFAGAGVSYRW